MTNYLNAIISELEFVEFMDELIHLQNNHGEFLKNKRRYITKEIISWILLSKDVKVIIENIGKSTCSIEHYLDDKLTVSITVDRFEEIIVMTHFMGTSLFNRLGKTDIAEIDFINKEKTKFEFRRIDEEHWYTNIDVIVKAEV